MIHIFIFIKSFGGLFFPQTLGALATLKGPIA